MKSQADCNLLQQTGIIVGGKFCEITGVTQRLITVSLFGVPSFIDDYDLSAKLLEYGCRLKTDWTHKCYDKYPNIENGTRYISLELPSEVGSLPYVVNVSGKRLKLMHNGQFRVCNLCLADDHLMRQCPNYKCRICEQQGHTASRCPVVQCYKCGKKGHKSFHCEEPAPTDPSISTRQKSHSDQAAFDRVKSMPPANSFVFGATTSKGVAFGTSAVKASMTSVTADAIADPDGGKGAIGSPVIAVGDCSAPFTLEKGPREAAVVGPAPMAATEASSGEETVVEPTTETLEDGPRGAASVGRTAAETSSTGENSIGQTTETPTQEAGMETGDQTLSQETQHSYADTMKNGDESMEEGSPEKEGGPRMTPRRGPRKFDWKKLLSSKGSLKPQFTRLKRTMSSDDVTVLKQGRSSSVKISPHRSPNVSSARKFTPRGKTPDT